MAKKKVSTGYYVIWVLGIIALALLAYGIIRALLS
jgi:hypothetical protein